MKWNEIKKECDGKTLGILLCARVIEANKKKTFYGMQMNRKLHKTHLYYITITIWYIILLYHSFCITISLSLHTDFEFSQSFFFMQVILIPYTLLLLLFAQCTHTYTQLNIADALNAIRVVRAREYICIADNHTLACSHLAFVTDL